MLKPIQKTLDTIQQLVIVTSGYPAPATPSQSTFVREVARGLARQGVECSVVAPVPLHRGRDRAGYPFSESDASVGGPGTIRIYRPRYLSLSASNSLRVLGPVNPTRIGFRQFEQAVYRTIRRQRLRPDALYGHFLYFGGAAAVRVGRRLNLPAFAAVGESGSWTTDWFGQRVAHRDLGSAAGFITVNSTQPAMLREQLGLVDQPIDVFPNGVDLTRFRPGDKAAARAQLGLPNDQLLVCSVGSFLHRKGIDRVGQAISGLAGVAGVFAGSGSQPPVADNIALCRRVLHEEIPLLLSACDLFVLPTLAEGSCNALVEAMACGLPIISSVGGFNDDLLDQSMSIRVDPLDVAAIRAAIVALRDDPARRDELSRRALEKAQQFDVNRRAEKILSFMAQHSACPR